jgi:hypothetical protein
MKPLFAWTVCLTFTLTLLSPGCKREAGPPPPLAAEQIPAEFAKTFGNADSEVKALADKVVAAVQEKDYAAAYLVVQNLCAAPNETEPQRMLATRAMLTLTGLLKAAEAQGDQKAAEALQVRKMFK